MKTTTCQSCGAKMNSNEEFCKYCGNANPDYERPILGGLLKDSPLFGSSNRNSSSYHQESHPEPRSTNKGSFNIGIFILLIILCWPVAIIYLIATCRK